MSATLISQGNFHFRRLFAAAALAAVLPAMVLAGQEPPAVDPNHSDTELSVPEVTPGASHTPAEVDNGVRFFESRVRPLLLRRCVECHSAESGPDNGALILETPAGIARGGTRGLLFSPDVPRESLLLRVIRYEVEGLQMPPDGRLPRDEVEVLQSWILSGAVLPEYRTEPGSASGGVDFAGGRKFWSFQPLQSVVVPSVARRNRSRGPIDAFVLVKLDEHELTSSPPAERATLLRRVTFDAIGLPPSPAELAEYLSDESDDAWERVVDRLLASPQFGERWARVWLDLARYTDQTPDWQSATDRGWLYRDWVVRALNDNLPFDQFLRLQLAADLVPNGDPSDLAALGFLGLSPTYWKELRLAPAVIEQIVADEWDERLDTVTRTFLGLTVACARCHDHKFDPISIQDYYALAGVFASTQLAERPLLPEPQAARVRTAREQVATLESRLRQLREARSPEAPAVEQEIAAIRSRTPDFEHPWAHVVREAAVHVLADGDEMTRLEYREGETRDLPVFRRGNPANPGEVIRRRFLTVFQTDRSAAFGAGGSGRRELAEAMLGDAQGLVARVMVNRIWLHHLGAGLVRTPSDLGFQGDRPTHPELLEYLAAELVSRSWDLKWLHREILLSATYCQSTADRAAENSTDPENLWLWRANRRRLDFEMWRDAGLTVSGLLDCRRGGPSQPVDDPENRRRTLYATIAREELHPMLRMHDFPEATAHSPRRETTVTPLQQLFVLNSPWMEQQADALLQRLRPLATESARIDAAYHLLFSRPPDEYEQRRAHEFLSPTSSPADSPADRGGDDRTTASQDVRRKIYFQALLGLNEFHFVD